MRASVHTGADRSGPETLARPSRPWAGSVVASILIALPWYWPFTDGPIPSALTGLSAWVVGALLVLVLPVTRDEAPFAVALGFVLAASGNAALGTMQYLGLGDGLAPWVHPVSAGLALGNVHQTNMLATLLCMGMISLGWLVRQERVSVGFAWMLHALLLTGMAATSSRTGLANLVLLSLLGWYWQALPTRQWLRFCFVSLFIYAVASVGLPWLLDHLVEGARDRDIFARLAETSTCSSRLYLWQNVWHLISQKPWTGWGMGELPYAHYITEYPGARYCLKPGNAHNLYLNVAFEYGLPVAIGLLLATIGLLWKFRPWEARDPVVQMVWAIFAVIGLHSMVEFPLWYGVFQVPMLMLSGLLWWRYSAVDGVRVVPVPFASPRARVVVSWVAMVVLGVVAGEYWRISQIYIPPTMRAEAYRKDTFDEATKSWLFIDHVLVARAVATPANRFNASQLLQVAQEAMHVAPDARIIRQLIASARLVGREDLVALHTRRFEVAWPKDFQAWADTERFRLEAEDGRLDLEKMLTVEPGKAGDGSSVQAPATK